MPFMFLYILRENKSIARNLDKQYRALLLVFLQGGSLGYYPAHTMDSFPQTPCRPFSAGHLQAASPCSPSLTLDFLPSMQPPLFPPLLHGALSVGSPHRDVCFFCPPGLQVAGNPTARYPLLLRGLPVREAQEGPKLEKQSSPISLTAFLMRKHLVSHIFLAIHLYTESKYINKSDLFQSRWM